MQVERVKVPLSQEEYEALLKLCEAEVRPVDDQIRYMVAKELRRRRFLVPTPGEALASSGQ